MRETCPACGGADWQPFLDPGRDLILTGDQRIAPGVLSKVICSGCGVVANTHPLSDADLQTLYGEAYQLNTLGREEHLFFTQDGPLPRSQVIFDWLAPHVPGDARRIVEIGSGEGNVLARIADRFPRAEALGFEGSRKAAELARAKGLDVRNELVLSADHRLPMADLVFSYNVLEHVEDVDAFISVLRAACTEGGRVVFGLPVQDDGGYDLFFAEHVWHFTSAHVRAVLERRGLRVLHQDVAHPVNRGAGLFVCEVTRGAVEAVRLPDVSVSRAIQERNRDHWLGVFGRLDRILADTQGSLAVYGSSEVFSMLMSQTSLGQRPIAFCLDEDPSKIGTQKHGIPVRGPGHLATHPVDAVLLTVNPRYSDQIRAKLAPHGVDVLSCFG